MWVGARDWRFGLAVVGHGVDLAAVAEYDNRPIFSFYAVVTLPFLVLALTLAMGKLIGTLARARARGVPPAWSWPGSFFVLVLVNFAWFWPIWTDELLTHSEWLDRIWFQRWI